jgi:hypothetical protein
MSKDELIQSYRLLDATLGQLEVSMGVQHELRQLRRTTVLLRRAGLQSRMVLGLLALVGGVPALAAMLPETWAQGRWVWPLVVAVVALGYLILLAVQLKESTAEEEALAALTPVRPGKSLESDYSYILMQISACGTRLSLIRAILRDGSLDEVTRDKFANAQRHFELLLDERAEWVDGISDTILSHEQAERARRWIEIARQAPAAA